MFSRLENDEDKIQKNQSDQRDLSERSRKRWLSLFKELGWTKALKYLNREDLKEE